MGTENGIGGDGNQTGDESVLDRRRTSHASDKGVAQHTNVPRETRCADVALCWLRNS